MNFVFCLIMVVPFGLLSRGVIHKGHHLSFFLATLVSLSSQIKNRYIRYFLYYSATIIILTFVLCVIGAIHSSVAYRAEQALYFLIAGTAILFMAQQSTIKLSTAYGFICGAALLQIAVCLTQQFAIDPIDLIHIKGVKIVKELGTWKMTGTLGNNNFLAAFIAISIPCFFRKRWIWLTPLHGVTLYYAHTSGAILALGAGLLYYCKDWRIRLSALATGFIYMRWVDTGFISSAQQRFVHWDSAWRQITDSAPVFLFGNGAGAAWGGTAPIHNDWLQMFHWFGLTGLILLVMAFFTINKSNRILTTCGIIAAVNATVNNPMFLAPTAYMILLIIGLMERKNDIC